MARTIPTGRDVDTMPPSCFCAPVMPKRKSPKPRRRRARLPEKYRRPTWARAGALQARELGVTEDPDGSGSILDRALAGDVDACRMWLAAEVMGAEELDRMSDDEVLSLVKFADWITD